MEMDDLNSTISSILGDPSKMEQLRQVAQSLGINTGGAEQSPPAGGEQPSGGGIDGRNRVHPAKLPERRRKLCRSERRECGKRRHRRAKPRRGLEDRGDYGRL